MYEYGRTLGRSHISTVSPDLGTFCNVISHEMSMVITIYSRENSLK